MKVEGLLIGAIGALFLVVTPVYWLMSGEIIGSVALLLSFLLCAMMTAYMVVWGRKHDTRLEDNKDAEIIEVACVGITPSTRSRIEEPREAVER